MLKVCVCRRRVCGRCFHFFCCRRRYPRSSIRGNYIEARTADVYTGPCFANGEAEQVGREAVFGWNIDNGELAGREPRRASVVGVVRSKYTLGLTSEPVNPAKAVLIVDSRANAEQRLALQSFAKHMGGDLLTRRREGGLRADRA